MRNKATSVNSPQVSLLKQYTTTTIIGNNVLIKHIYQIYRTRKKVFKFSTMADISDDYKNHLRPDNGGLRFSAMNIFCIRVSVFKTFVCTEQEEKV